MPKVPTEEREERADKVQKKTTGAKLQYQKAPVSICRCTTVDQQHSKQCGIQREFTMRAVFFGIFIASNALNSVECALTRSL
jgi:hypothetical protein